MKPELNNDSDALKLTLKELNAKQDPRRCEKVDYKALVRIDGVAKRIVNARTKNADKWLDNLFGKDK